MVQAGSASTARPKSDTNRPQQGKRQSLQRIMVLHWLFPVTVLAFLGPMVSYVNIVLNSTTRWLVLAVLATYLAHRGTLLLALKSAVGPLLAASLYWTIVTTGWSEAPQLSLLKSLALACVVVTLVSGGLQWSMTVHPRRVFIYMLPIAGLALFTAFWPGARANVSSYGDTTIYSGLSGNPNALGILCAMGFIGVVAALAQAPRATQYRVALWLVAGVLCLISLWAKSRASIIVMMCTGLGVLIALRMVQQAVLLVVAAWLAVVVSLAFPSLVNEIEDTYVRKGISREAGGILHSRHDVWDESYEQALKGGWIGGGYGVTIGEGMTTDVSVTAVGYGREKANSQLAIIEETGWIGLFLYVLLVVGLLRTLLRGFSSAGDVTARTNLGIATGAVVGFLLHSAFEAWWVAPGAPEAPFFWGLVGVSVGLASIEIGRLRDRQRLQYADWLARVASGRRSTTTASDGAEHGPESCTRATVK